MLPYLQVQDDLSSTDFFGVGFYSVDSRALKRQTSYHTVNIFQAKPNRTVLLTSINLSTEAFIKGFAQLHVKYE